MVGILFFLLVVLVSLIVNHVSRSTLRRRGVRVQATCVSHAPGAKGKTKVQMEFVDAHGATVRKELGVHFSDPVPIAIGAMTDIVYDPEGRTSPLFAVDAYAGKWAPLLIGIVSVLATLAALSLFL